MATRMQQRRGTAAQWTSADPILAAGEIGFESDTGQFKIGDGINHWSILSYFKNLEDLGGNLDDYILLTQKGEPLGVARLNVDGDVDSSQLGTVDTFISAHNSATTSVHGIADTSLLATTTSVDTSIAAHSTDTTSVHGIADTSLLATTASVDTSISTHNSDTTSVHGIADTSLLATTASVDTSIGTHNSDTTDVHGIADTSALATTTSVNTSISAHNSDITNVHGIADTSELVLISDSRLSDTRTPTDNTVSTVKIVNSAITAEKISGDAITTAKILDGAVTSAKIEDGTIVNSDINASAAIDWTKLAVSSTVSETELGYLDGVTSGIQGQFASTTAAIATAKAEAIADATAQVSAVIASAPTAMNTLDELAAALGDDANFAATVTTALDGKVVSLTPISQKTDSYTLSSLTERDSLIEINKASATTLTIPAESTLAFSVGTSIDVLQTGSGQVTIAGAAGVTVNGTPGLKLRTQWSSATLLKRASDTWVVVGDLSA